MKPFNNKKRVALAICAFVFLVALANPAIVKAGFGAIAATVKNMFYVETTWKYRLHFDANTGSGTMADRIVSNPKVSFKLPKNEFTKYGNDFVGWNNLASGTGNIDIKCTTDDEPIISEPLTTTPDATVNLYAQWEPIDFKIVYNANGGEGEDVVQEMKWTLSGTDNESVAKIYSFSSDCHFHKDEHNFLGWSTSQTGPVEGAVGTDTKGYYQSGTQHMYLDKDNNIQNIYGITPDQLGPTKEITLYAIYAPDKKESFEGYYKISGTSQKGGDSTYQHWHLKNDETIETKEPDINTTNPGEPGTKYTGIFYIGDVDAVETVTDPEEWDTDTKPHTYSNK